MLKRKIKGNICDPKEDRLLSDDPVAFMDARGNKIYDEELYVTLAGLYYIYRYAPDGIESIYDVELDGAKEWINKHNIKVTDEELIRYGIPTRYYLSLQSMLYLSYLKDGKDIGGKIIEDLLKTEYERKQGVKHDR